MAIDSLRRYLAVALSFMGSAILLFSCKAPSKDVEEPANFETLMTEYSENLSIMQSENGERSYHFETPIMEGYAMAHDPYREFRKGIKITMYDESNQTTGTATLTANYAISYEDRKLWEAKGDVVATNSDGRRLYTSQLFWNQATHRIYSNVDSKIVNGDEVYHCEGFESDEQMKSWTYRKLKGVTYVNDGEFSSSADTVEAKPAPESKPQDSEAEEKQNRLQRRQSKTRRSAFPATNGNVKRAGSEPMSLELPKKK